MSRATIPLKLKKVELFFTTLLTVEFQCLCGFAGRFSGIFTFPKVFSPPPANSSLEAFLPTVESVSRGGAARGDPCAHEEFLHRGGFWANRLSTKREFCAEMSLYIGII